jgi:hypothetical protein
MGFSSHRNFWSRVCYRRGAPLALAALGLFVLVETSGAQNGHAKPDAKPGPVLRSIAVLEWLGEPGKPSASRLIPVTVFHDGEYEDGGLYLARPEPLALDNGTEYQLMKAGLPQGVFDIFAAQQMSGDWFGYGAWKPLPPPEAFHHLKESVVPPQVVDGGDDRRPHFRKSSPATQGPGGGAPTQANPPEDSDRPTLSKRPASTPDSSATANPETAEASGNMETATAGGDPDRPHLSRGAKDLPKEPAHLEGTPPALEQMIAVSDAATRPEHSFLFSWSNPDDANKMQALLTTIAQQAIAKAAAPAGAKPPVRSTHPPVHRSATTATTHKKAVPRPPVILLTDVQFRAFELTYSGGSTLVLTARTAGDESKAKYVTVIAQPDIYGEPHVLFTQVTNADDLDAAPRMRLVDAVDAAGDNRGDLLFELRGNTTRQFAIYRVASGRVDQMIATGPIPLGKGSDN